MPADGPDTETHSDSEALRNADSLPDPEVITSDLGDLADRYHGLTEPAVDAVSADFFDATDLDAPAIDGYWVREPFAYVSIGFDHDTDEHRYRVLEPRLDADERYIRDDLARVVRHHLLDVDIDPEETTDDEFRALLDDVVASEAAHLPALTSHKIRYYLDRDFTGFGAIDPFMRDVSVEDLSCDGENVPFYVYLQDYGHTKTNRAYDEARLTSIVRRLAQAGGRHISAARPLLTTTLPDGSRVQLTIGSDVATRGPNFTIRKFRTEPFTPIDIVEYGTTTIPELAYLWFAIEHNASIVFAGPTASGKTTTMNALSAFIPPTAKVVSIEETRELRLPTQNWIANLTRESDLGADRPTVDTYELLSEALHQRPDFILVGEIRTNPDVARTFFQAIGTGHAGFTTFHADSGPDVLRRLSHDPLSVPPELLSHLDVISVQQLYVDDDRVRRIQTIHEVESATDADEKPCLHEVFRFDPATDAFAQTGDSHLLRTFADEQGWTIEELHDELSRRIRVLTHLAEDAVTDYETVSNTIFRYHRNPDAVLEHCPPEPDYDFDLAPADASN